MTFTFPEELHIDGLVTQLFPHDQGPICADWFSGTLVGCRGERRHVGYPPRRIFDDEIYFEISTGTVTRQWLMDLRAVPDQTDEELRLSLPRFLWPARLRDETGECDDEDATQVAAGYARARLVVAKNHDSS